MTAISAQLLHTSLLDTIDTPADIRAPIKQQLLRSAGSARIC